MLDQVTGDTRQIGRLPHENAYVVPQKPDERVFLFGI